MRKTVIYLAGRYSRRLELCRYRDEIHGLGSSYKVRARWLDGGHQISDKGVPIGDGGEELVEGGANSMAANVLRSKFAEDDLLDVQGADMVINFTEPPRSLASRGGRHVELGIALGGGMKRILVVGHRENIFHWLPCIEFFTTWQDCLKQLATEAAS